MADVLDIIDIDDAKRAVGLSSSRAGQEEALEGWVTGISRRVDGLYGPVVQRTVTAEQHRGGCSLIIPRKVPILSVTTLTEYSGTTPQVLAAENFPTVTANDYYLDPVTSHIHRKASGYDSVFAFTRVILTYEAGRFTTTATVGEDYKQAARGVLVGMFAKYAGNWARGGDPTGEPVFFDEMDSVLKRWLGAPLPGFA